ncbi:MAG: STAS domain-containing protein [Clostridia bacterium]|nr:STAS domain-containing protein [Clostridia bacterium]
MLNINKTLENATMTFALEGRLDTVTAPELEQELHDLPENVTELIFDLAKLEYISSAGLRVLLSAQKSMNVRGKMIVRNVNEVVAEIFEVTCFTDILTIE